MLIRLPYGIHRLCVIRLTLKRAGIELLMALHWAVSYAFACVLLADRSYAFACVLLADRSFAFMNDGSSHLCVITLT